MKLHCVRLQHFKTSYLLMGICISISIYYAVIYNALAYIFAYPFYFFQYPLDVDLKKLVDQVMLNQKPDHDPINPINYPIILDNNRLCKTEDGDDDSIFLIWVIKSRMENFDLRDTIRKTWGAEDIIPFTPIRRIFVLGVDPGNLKLQQKIGIEHRDNRDIVQAYFTDAYFNNTLKLELGFQWAVSKCRGARYIGFTDDDFFISPFNVVDILKPIPQAQWENFIMGFIWDLSMPYRIPHSKWYISLSEYPYRFWPPYPTAGSFFVSMLTAERLYIGMQYTKFIRFDDVFVGLVAWKLGIPMRHNKNFYFYTEDFKGISRSHKKVIAVHGYKDPEDLFKLWQKYLKLRELTVSGY